MISHLRSGACNDVEKAKLIYLIHHLGVGDARLFINNEITEKRAHALLEAQVCVRSTAERYELTGDYIETHRNWLAQYIDNNILLKYYFCLELTKTPMLEDVFLLTIVDKI